MLYRGVIRRTLRTIPGRFCAKFEGAPALTPRPRRDYLTAALFPGLQVPQTLGNSPYPTRRSSRHRSVMRVTSPSRVFAAVLALITTWATLTPAARMQDRGLGVGTRGHLDSKYADHPGSAPAWD